MQASVPTLVLSTEESPMPMFFKRSFCPTSRSHNIGLYLIFAISLVVVFITHHFTHSNDVINIVHVKMFKVKSFTFMFFQLIVFIDLLGILI